MRRRFLPPGRACGSGPRTGRGRGDDDVAGAGGGIVAVEVDVDAEKSGGGGGEGIEQRDREFGGRIDYVARAGAVEGDLVERRGSIRHLHLLGEEVFFERGAQG